MEHISSPSAGGDFTIKWHRNTGLFSTEIADDIITGASANNWPDFQNLLANLPNTSRQQQVISPELMTTADIPLCDIAKRSTEQIVKSRLNQIETVSLHLPHTTFIVGTPEYTKHTIYNSLIAIKDGKHSVKTRKSTLTPAEDQVFSPSLQQEPLGQLSRHLICADLITYTETTASSIYASCCWAMPLIKDGIPGYTPPPDEERYLYAMRNTIKQLMAKQAVSNLFVVDRTPVGGTTQPFNCFVAQT